MLPKRWIRYIEATVEDHRGRGVPLGAFGRAELLQAKRTGVKVPPDVESDVWQRQLRRVVGPVFVVIGLGMFTMLFLGIAPRGMNYLHAMTLIIIAIMYQYERLPLRRIRKEKEASRDRMLKAGLCASCGYVLQGISPEQDGCIVCPECGAAWRFVKVEAEQL